MSLHEWLGVCGIVAGMLLGLPVIRRVVRCLGASAEVARKMIHVTMGLVCCGFPWWFDRAMPVWVLAGMATIPLGLIRFFPRLKQGVGSVLHGIERPSYGEVLFAPAVAGVFFLADGDWVLYLIPVLILTLADAAGALVGTRWGRRRYGSGEGFKTVEGSLIFCFTAVICSIIPLLLSQRMDWENACWVALILGILAMMAEGISDQGFDNIVLPVGCYWILERLILLETPSLVGRFFVLVVLLGVVLLGARWSTLSGGALLGSVLLGYGCAVIADWRFALPPLAVFGCHLLTTRKHGLTGVLDHRLDAVISLAMGCLPWVVAVESGGVPSAVGLAGVSFAMGAQLAILDAATRRWVTGVSVNSVRSTVKGFAVAAFPGLVWLWSDVERLVLPMGVAVVVIDLVTILFQKIDQRYHSHATGLWVIKGFLALAASLAALLM